MDFTPEFFEKENRFGFEIPTMIKRAWAAELEVLQVISEICGRRGLQYFADWGTLLGAVRHRGFIPWDDDIDICLKREDYDVLIRVLPEELPEGFAMAGLYADSERLRTRAQWLHSRVIVDDNWDFQELLRRFHGFPYSGAGVDIFPLDYLPEDRELFELQKLIVGYGLLTLQGWDMFLHNGELENRLIHIEELFGAPLPRDESTMYVLQRRLDATAAFCYENEAVEMTESPFYLDIESYHLKKEWYEKAITLPFEQIEIAVPCAYQEVLTAQYGDYMTPVQGLQAHTYPFYAPREKELVRQIRANGFEGTVEDFCQKILNGELRVKMI